ncbi:MAG: radical SAM protein [Desulfamplus sp.]|nr:radical SAM protein [Desulfamplus sp.]
MSDNSPHILCVNPWIHDFAAFDFWAKPLGLLQLAAIIRAGGAEVSFLDCLDRFHPKYLQEIGKKKLKTLDDGRGSFRKRSIPLPNGVEIEAKYISSTEKLSPEKKRLFLGKSFSRYGVEPDWFRQDLKALSDKIGAKNGGKFGKPDLILVTSLMTYWASGVKETISLIKEIFPDTPVVLGGIYATLCTAHAKKNSMADEVIIRSGEQQIFDIIKKYTGFSLSSTISSISISPLNLDLLPYPALDLVSRLTYAPILTSRGCPFTCSYCASSFLEPQMRRRSPESVFDEICYWHKNYGVHNFAFYDDALLIDPEKYILPLLDKILSLPLSFYTPNALHIRQMTKDVASMMFKTGFKTIRLGLETTDFSTTRKDDKKVRADEFFYAVGMLKEAGFRQEEIGAYLLCGLPNQNLDDVEQSIALVKKSGIMPVLAYYTPIPHTPMWQEAVKVSRFDLENEPFFTNNTLFPCVNSEHDIKKISELKKMAK